MAKPKPKFPMSMDKPSGGGNPFVKGKPGKKTGGSKKGC